MFVLIVTQPIEILNPAEVRLCSAVFFLGDQEKIDGCRSSRLRQVERVEGLVFVAEHIHGQVVQFFDLLYVL